MLLLALINPSILLIDYGHFQYPLFHHFSLFCHFSVLGACLVIEMIGVIGPTQQTLWNKMCSESVLSKASAVA